MIRKKNIGEINETDTVANLREDEEIVLSDVRTIRKNKRQPAAPLVIDIEPDEEDAELIEDDDNLFPVGTVGYRAFGESDGSEPAVTECNILVTRKPDGAGDNFLEPCKGKFSKGPLRSVDLTTPESEIEEMVRLNHGGGHYYLQTQFGNRHGRGWSVSLADSQDAVLAAKTAAAIPAPSAPAPPTAPVDPMAAFITSLRQTAELRGLLFGDTEKQLRDEIARLRDEAANAPPAEPKSEKLAMIEFAMAAPKSELADRVLDGLFPSTETPSRHWIAETLSVVLENKDAIAGVIGSLLGGVIPTAAPAQPSTSFADMMRQPPPGELSNIPPAPPGGFRRNRPEPPPAESEPGAVTTGFLADDDANAIDADFTEEPKPDEPKRSRKAA